MLIFLFHVLGYDAWFYLSHLFLHTQIGWIIHKVHHEKRKPTALDACYEEWIESIFQSFGFGLPFLFGLWEPNQILFAVCFIITRELLRRNPQAVRWIGNHHLLHHKYPQYNFGDYWIDRMCGTAFPGAEARSGVVHL